jgi:serine/threonine protein kinase
MASQIALPPGYSALSVLCETGALAVCRASFQGRPPTLIKLPLAARPQTSILQQLEHEYEVARGLAPGFVLQPLGIERVGGTVVLLLEDFAGHMLADELAAPMGLGRFFEIAVALSAALAAVHRQGVVHKDINPANVLLADEWRDAEVPLKLTGFGLATRQPRQRQTPDSPELIAGTLAYLAPEQTGRMNRSIDSRSDLYALGSPSTPSL